MTDTKLFDIEPGGESTQYESIRTVTEPPPKQSGQMGAGIKQTISESRGYNYNSNSNSNPRDYSDDGAASSNRENSKLAREQWFGGVTNNLSGEADRDLKPESQQGDIVAAKTRRQQGYGPGSGVGA